MKRTELVRDKIKGFTCITGVIMFIEDYAEIIKVYTIERLSTLDEAEMFEDSCFYSGDDYIILELFQGKVTFHENAFI